jgi:hypothetical protein
MQQFVTVVTSDVLPVRDSTRALHLSLEAQASI